MAAAGSRQVSDAGRAGEVAHQRKPLPCFVSDRGSFVISAFTPTFVLRMQSNREILQRLLRGPWVGDSQDWTLAFRRQDMHIRKYIGALGAAALLLVALGAPAQAAAQSATSETKPQSRHVVSPEELNQDTAQRVQSRQADETAVRDLLKTAEGQEALRRAKVDYARVDKAMAQMSDEDLAKIGERSRQARVDF